MHQVVCGVLCWDKNVDQGVLSSGKNSLFYSNNKQNSCEIYMPLKSSKSHKLLEHAAYHFSIGCNILATILSDARSNLDIFWDTWCIKVNSGTMYDLSRSTVFRSFLVIFLNAAVRVGHKGEQEGALMCQGQSREIPCLNPTKTDTFTH